jgi:2-iminobutanoate/2-iminopropanoate deaminase
VNFTEDADMKIYIDPNSAPAIGPYCHAVRTGNLLFISGQVPLNAEGEVVGQTMAEQTEQALDNLESILMCCGATWKNVVKTTVFIADMQGFAEMNKVYAQRFGGHKPARSCVEVSGLAKGMLLEIEAVAEYEA